MSQDRYALNKQLAQMLKGGVIMDVTTPEQARIAEEAGACAVMALERIPADIRAAGGVSRMSDPKMIKGIQEAVSIPVMAKCRIGHFAEAQILEAIEIDYIDESEVLSPADDVYHIDKTKFKVPFVCGAKDLGEALRRINEGASMIRTKGEPGTGDVVQAVRHMRKMNQEIARLTSMREDELFQAAKELLKKIIPKYHISLISLGNGTASRESEQIIVELLKEIPEKVQYVITNEAGASVYSASKLATEEFPNFDVGQRSAASIARRLQDPLAELVKITPQSIGVGQYQHDMNQKKLGEALSGVVEDCVNKVGVDLNTASASLLEYISGISKVIAKNIVAYREENGRFESRRELLKVAKLGPKAFEQCAGFMRISEGKNPLDATGVHPESYAAAEKLLKKQGYEADAITAHQLTGLGLTIGDYKKLAEELGIGEITLRDIVKELEKPARDPRDEMPKPILRTDVLEMKDLKEGMVLKGTVRNVIDFGVFVDIGVHQDGLVHISQITDRYIKHPLEAVSVGDIVDVKVMSVDLKKKRIQLTMRGI